MDLRPYQIEALERTRQSFGRGHRNVLLVLPTGGGKTACGGEIARGAIAKGKRVLWLAERRELIFQAASRMPVPAGMIMAGTKPDYESPIQVASVDTLVTRTNVPPADLVVVDEAHHSVSKTIRGLLASYPNAHVLGLTATPERSDGTALGDVFQEMVIGSTVRELTDLGFLVECDVKAASLGKSLAQDPVKAWLEHSGGRPGFVFAKSVAHSRDIVAGLVAAGVLAVHVDGTTAKGIRDRAVEDFRRGRIDVLCSMGVFTEGTDLPRATVCLLARAFTHASLYLQCIGRVLRPSPGKGRALIIDLIGSVHEHGLPDDERIWSLDGEPHRLADSAQAVKQCDVCGCAYRPGPPACPMCGAKAEPEAPPKIEERPLDDLGRRMAPLMPGASQEQKDRKWRELVDKGRESGYNPKWASVRYHAIFGQWRNR